MTVFYNDFHQPAARTLEAMMEAGMIGEGTVDGRDVATIQPGELAGYDRVHLFAGIGGFEIAARLAAWPDSVQLWTGGFPCFAAGTMVLTDSGYRPIESVAVGDSVLTHLGRWKPVIAVMARDGADLVRIRAQGVPGVVTTREHPFYARTYRERFPTLADGRRRRERIWSTQEWVDAGGLTNRHVIGQVLPAIDASVEGNEEFWWLVGRYVADGWRVRRHDRGPESGRVVICCATREAADVAERIAAAGFNATRSDERTVVKFHITSCQFYRFLEKFGHKAHGKTLPACAMSLDQIRAAALLNGYISGDGYRDDRAGYRRITTVSKSLALCVAALSQRAFGIVASVRRCAMPARTTIEGRQVNQRDFFVVTIPDSNRSAFVDGDYGWKLVRGVEPCGVGRVYNIAVADDESYCADGAIVHNCQPFSVAGRRQGTRDDRWLWPEFARLLDGCRPEFVVVENVPAIDSEPDMVLDRVCADLEAFDYEVAPPFEIPACAVDAAHERTRVWIMAHCHESGSQERRRVAGDTGTQRSTAERGGAGVVGDADGQGRLQPGGAITSVGGRADYAGEWGDTGWIACHDGRLRRIPLGLLDPAVVLADGLPSRTLALHGLGNSIVPQVAAELMRAMLECARC